LAQQALDAGFAWTVSSSHMEWRHEAINFEADVAACLEIFKSLMSLRMFGRLRFLQYTERHHNVKKISRQFVFETKADPKNRRQIDSSNRY
jgi:hypothetical protein